MTFAAQDGPVTTRNGFRILPDKVGDWAADRVVSVGDAPPAATLDGVLQQIAARYGQATTEVVAMQLEYPKKM